MPHKDPIARAEYFRQYNAKHKERRARYLESRKTHNKQRQRRYYLANQDKAREAARKWKSLHPEHYSKWAKEYYKLHPEKANAWLKKDPERARRYRTEYSRKWRMANRALVQQRIRARKAKCKENKSATNFYAFVRSRKRIRCYYCGEWVSGKEAHVDHVIALAKEGNHASENLCASCPECNLKKRDKLPSEIRFVDQGLLNI